jgi:hypothetical protein
MVVGLGGNAVGAADRPLVADATDENQGGERLDRVGAAREYRHIKYTGCSVLQMGVNARG